MCGRLVLDPEQRIPDRQLRDHLVEILRAAEPVHLDRPEGSLVEVDCGSAVAHRELRLDVRLPHAAILSEPRRMVCGICDKGATMNET